MQLRIYCELPTFRCMFDGFRRRNSIIKNDLSINIKYSEYRTLVYCRFTNRLAGNKGSCRAKALFCFLCLKYNFGSVLSDKLFQL